MNTRLHQLSSWLTSFVALWTTHPAPWLAHTWYRMQACAAHQDIKTVGREQSWCNLNSEYLKALALFFIPG